MQSGQASKIWLALGASLAISGGFTVVMSLPEGGETLWLGVGLIAAGSLALRQGLAGTDQVTRPPPRHEGAARASADDSHIEPELRVATPREVTLTARGKLVLAVWVAVLAVFGLLSHQHFGRLPAPPSKKLLDQEGVSTSATVHSQEMRSLENGRTLYFLGYSFTADAGRPMRVNQSVPPRVYARISEGDTTEVVYMPLNPQRHYLPEITSPVTTGMVVFIAAVLVLAAGFAEAQRRLHRRLAVSGNAVSGFTADVRRRGGVRTFLVNYDASGKRQTLRARERNPELRNGQTVTVLYDPAIPSRAVVYRHGMYKART
ncbi:MAG: hypothetical protein OXJ37_16665 [Bryobacterales bacterium]|nr:hypothetical protein [Bryobacterales bacterium]